MPNLTLIGEMTAMNEIKTLAELNELSVDSAVIVDFYADWCGPCKRLLPIMEEIASEVSIPVVKANVDKASDLAAHFGVMSVPTVIAVKDGQKIDGFSGWMPKEPILGFVNKYI